MRQIEQIENRETSARASKEHIKRKWGEKEKWYNNHNYFIDYKNKNMIKSNIETIAKDKGAFGGCNIRI